tara:strand:- start:2772 stop:3521 length:750 start_codon:yes stop_codon:yes gene_type:complete
MGQIISNNLPNSDEHEDLYNDYIKLKSKYDSDRVKLESLNKLNNDLEETISKMTENNSKNSDLENKISELKVENNNFESENNQIKIKLTEQELIHNDLFIKNNELETNNHELEIKIDNLKLQNDDLEIKNSDFLIKNSKLETKYNDIKYDYNLKNKEINIIQNKLNLCEELNIKYTNEIEQIIKSEGLTLKKIETINNTLNYYLNNQENIVNLILKKNNTLLPDTFEKNIIRNAYKTTIELIVDNLKNI